MTPLERFQANEKLVYYVYEREFSTQILERDEIISEGRLALWKACKNFDDTRGFQFSTYACVAIRNSMIAYNKRIQKHLTVISLDSKINDEEDNILYLIDTIGKEEDLSAKYLIQMCLEKSSLKEHRVIDLLLKGYTQTEVAIHLKISQTTVSRYLRRFKKLIEKEIANENNTD